MEPLDDSELNDRELNQVLREWKAPLTPARLEQRVFPRSELWWKWLMVGAIRVPVPVALAMVALVALMFYFRTSDKPVMSPQNASQPGAVSLADFQPVRQLEPRIIGRGNESH